MLRVGPLPLCAADLVHAREPGVDGVVVVLEHGPQRVGAVGAEPELRVQVANQRVAVLDVLDAAVDAVDVAELAAHLHALLAVAGGRISLRARVARCHLVGELELLADEVESPCAELECVDGIRLTQRGRVRGKLVCHRVDDGRRWRRIGCACLRNQLQRVLGVHAQLVRVGPNLPRILLAVLRPRIKPEETIGAVADLGREPQQIVRGHQLLLRHLELAGHVAVEAGPKFVSNCGMELSPCCQAAAQPKRMPYQLFEASASPSSYQIVFSWPVAPIAGRRA